MTHQPTNITAHFNRAATSYDDVAILQRQHVARAVDGLAGCVEHDAAIADIGCGTGVFARLAGERGLDWRVTGVDLSPAMCAAAAPHQPQILVGDMHAIPLESASMDASISAFCLQWSNAPAQAIGELVRITKPGGSIALLTFLDGTLGELSTACEAAGAPRKTNQFHSATDYQAWCEAAGLSVVAAHNTLEKTYYPSAAGLFQTLKQMGATNSNTGSMKGLGGRRELLAIREIYEEQFGGDAGVVASWHVGFWLLRV